MISFIERVNSQIHSIIWGPFVLILFISIGLYLSIRTGFIQISRVRYIRKSIWAMLTKKDCKDSSNISPFQAVTTALAGTLGTGNIVGIATAIVLGGPGAVFWMWVSAFFGMVTKFGEIILALKYRVKNKKGEYCGGPMYYLKNGLGLRILPVLFCICCIFASFGIGNLTQINSASTAIEGYFKVPSFVTGLVVSILTGLIIIGGIKRIGSFTEKFIPLMTAIFTFSAILIIIIKFRQIPHAFKLIFSDAFNFKSAAGGILGFTVTKGIRYGMSRGVFSNEAGLGSAPIAHAASNNKEPVEQGFWGIVEVFIDTIVMCTLTALVLLTSGVCSLKVNPAEMTTIAFTNVLGKIGGFFIAISIAFFAISTIISWCYYGEKSIEFLFKSSKFPVLMYKIIYVVLVFVGAISESELIWAISDTLNGLMALPNLIGIVMLSPVIISETKKYFKKLPHK